MQSTAGPGPPCCPGERHSPAPRLSDATEPCCDSRPPAFRAAARQKTDIGGTLQRRLGRSSTVKAGEGKGGAGERASANRAEAPPRPCAEIAARAEAAAGEKPVGGEVARALPRRARRAAGRKVGAHSGPARRQGGPGPRWLVRLVLSGTSRCNCSSKDSIPAGLAGPRKEGRKDAGSPGCAQGPRVRVGPWGPQPGAGTGHGCRCLPAAGTLAVSRERGLSGSGGPCGHGCCPSALRSEPGGSPVLGMTQPAPRGMDAGYIAVEVMIAVLSIVGNVLVCWAVAINSTLKNATNYFLVSLAVADIAVGLLAIPFAITISVGLETNFHCCLFLACFVLVLTQSSIFSLLAVAVDRYLAIKIPLRYKSIVTGKRARGLIGILWLLSFSIGLIPLMGWNLRDVATGSCPNATNGTRGPGEGGRPACLVKCLFENVVTMSYMVYFNFFGCVLLPLLAMLGIYVKIFMVACRQLRQMELVGNSRTTLQKEVNAAKSLAIIVGVFAICWLPLHILNCLTLFDKDFGEQKPEELMNFTIILSHINSVVNPIIYAYRIQDFRCTFRKILWRYVLCKPQDFPKYPKGSRASRHLSVSNISSTRACI